MNPGECSSEDNRDRRAGGSSRREFLGRTIRGGALLAATTVLGDDLRSNQNQAESRTDGLPGNRSADAGVTTADLMADKLVEWGVSVVFGLPGDKIGLILDALRRRQEKIRFVLVRHEEGAAFMASGYAKFTGKLVSCPRNTRYFVAIKMGRRQGARREHI
jgi:Thiamine pyrophosphate enzyme, N-terminal TPP binding domain